ncbi:MAG: hypothetical protein VB835_00670 [Pirellulales bacterium]
MPRHPAGSGGPPARRPVEFFYADNRADTIAADELWRLSREGRKHDNFVHSGG